MLWMNIKSRYLIVICLLWPLLTTALSTTRQTKKYSPTWVEHTIVQLLEPNNLWILLSHRFQIEHDSNRKEIQAQIQWYQSNRYYLKKMALQAKPYLHYIVQQVHIRHLPAELALLPFIESAFDPYAFSRAGATGLWQMMPKTANGFGLQTNWWYDGRRDIYASTQAALDYLEYLGEYFHGDWLLALAAYDSGEGTVKNAIHKAYKQHRATDFWSLELPSETKRYVPRLLALAAIINHPDKYGVTLPMIQNKTYLVPVNIGSQLELNHAATLAGIQLEELYHLNPGFNHWATSPKGPHRLLLPIALAHDFKAALAKIPCTQRIHYDHHIVKSGETLIQIAKHYHIPVPTLQYINQLTQNHHLRSGAKLKIPPHDRRLAEAPKHFNKKYQQHRRVLYMRKLPSIHIIQQGESLSSIATHYHLNTQQLAKHNHITDINKIRIGQKITLH